MPLRGDWRDVVAHLTAAETPPPYQPPKEPDVNAPQIVKKEPVAIAGALTAVLNALVLLDVININGDQIAGINIAVVAVLGLFVRSQVQPKDTA